jgi:hypothetical protein
LPA